MTANHSPNPHSPINTPKLQNSTSRAFTLVEMLVVIAIIGILAALIVGGAGISSAKARIARVQAERDALMTAIEHYQKAKNFYPPDNNNDANPQTSDPVQNLLFYELTGVTVVTAPGSSTPTAFKSGITGEQLSAGSLQNNFNVGGILNASSDPAAVQNFYPGLKANQHQLVNSFHPSGATFTVLGVPVPGPNQLTGAPNGPGSTGMAFINPWHYNVSHPTNNVDSYDLWMDIILRGTTNRISNWSKDPQPL